MSSKLGIGIVGAGGFAAFASHAFTRVEGIHISGVYDINADAAASLARHVNSRTFDDLQSLLRDSDTDLVYIASPPFLHYEQSKLALEAGKHVICEKPAALLTMHAQELALLAREKDLLYVVNLMQRYNPLYDFVSRIIREKWLGDFVHGFFENYASDEKLVQEHWFWDKSKSGGIFIEHAVHFFDMFDGWFGKGELIHALEIAREGVEGEVMDRVQAIVLYQNSPVNFYHGFNQPKVLDRQELRLQFDRGDITLYEWIPVKIRMHGLFTAEQMEDISSLLPAAETEISGNSIDGHKSVYGKFRKIEYDDCATITAGNIDDKMDRYEQLVISMINDQWAWIKDRSHQRRITDYNAVESLRIAEEATNRAVKY